MSGYRVEFHAKADAETVGLPEDAFIHLIDALAEAARDPWANSREDRVFNDPAFRWVPFDRGLGVIQFIIDEPQQTLRVHSITWTG